MQHDRLLGRRCGQLAYHPLFDAARIRRACDHECEGGDANGGAGHTAPDAPFGRSGQPGRPDGCVRVRTGGIETGRSIPGTGPLVSARNSIADFLPPFLEPVAILDGRRQSRLDGGRLHALDEHLPAAVQRMKIVDLFAGAERPGSGLERDGLIAEYAELGQHEFAEVLAKVAEEHQAQAQAQRRDLESIDGFRFRAPPRHGPRLGKRRAHLGEQRRLGLFRAALGKPQHAHRVGLAEERDQIRGAEQWAIIQPPQADQRPGGRLPIEDLGVPQAARAEQRALAHDHAHQQRAGGRGKRAIFRDEPPFIGRQQVAVAPRKRIQHGLEIGEVIERRGCGLEPV